jgi:hypothetical protein
MVKNRIIKGGGVLDWHIGTKTKPPQRPGCPFFPFLEPFPENGKKPLIFPIGGIHLPFWPEKPYI